ncbi:MAG: hypothetical protein SAJ37_18370 [Oscillatoria sp. PMC 1068.18]|nr:hypothetical protein [Oscillatoria sp. PMC 1076.18]MEC4990702.1 hypothetical protein [Oscillatoria sp. PMC 1068.18]
MPNPFLGVRIPLEIDEAIAARMKETGQSKSEIAIAALRSYLGITSCQDRLSEIEQRLSTLENIALELYSLRQAQKQSELVNIEAQKNQDICPKIQQNNSRHHQKFDESH